MAHERLNKLATRSIENKVFTTKVIRLLDDRTRYAQSLVADLQSLGLTDVGVRDGPNR